jgi:hypothetical protein
VPIPGFPKQEEYANLARIWMKKARATVGT